MGDTSEPWRRDRIFWSLLALAVALRSAAFDAYAIHHPDESIQYLEQAHRLVFGYGVVPWEFRYSIRSWLMPLLLAGPMQLGEWIDPGGTFYLVLPRATIAAMNISPVVAAWFIGARASRQHAIVAMAVVAIWIESVLFSVQTLSESLAIACFLPAVALFRREASATRIAGAGVLMALAGLLRFQFAPAIAVYAVLVAGRDGRAWRWLVMGGLPVVLFGAAIDMAMGLTPYEWIANNYRMNIVNERMRKIGGVSYSTYLTDFLEHYNFAGPIVIGLSLMAGRRFRPLLIAAWINIAFHQFIGHKEWRYLWFSVDILLLLAAIGSVNATRRTIFGRRFARPRSATATAVLIAAWGIASLGLSMTDLYRFDWRTDGAASRIAAIAARDPRVCGLAVNRYQSTQFGYAIVHKRIPVYLLRPDEKPWLSRPGEHARAFNAVLVNRILARPTGFPTRVACGGHGLDAVCLYTRPGGCRSQPDDRPLEHQAQMLAVDM